MATFRPHKHRALSSSIHLLLVVASIVLSGLGCPDPNRRIWFNEDGKRSRTREVKSDDGEVKIQFDSHSGFNTHRTQYRLWLHLDVDHKRECGEIQVKPKAIEVLFAGRPMQLIKEYRESDGGRLSVNCKYSIEPDTSEVLLDETGKPRVVAISIVLNDFIMCGDAVVPFDTVRAVELRTTPSYMLPR